MLSGRRGLQLITAIVWLALAPVCLAAQSTEIESLVSHTQLGDLDEIVERRSLRVLVVYNKLTYFLDGPRQRGASYDGALGFEKFLNEKLATGPRKIQALIIPVSRDQILHKLVNGEGDIAIANLSITDERLEVVNFSDPVLSNVEELVVTHQSSQHNLASLADLAGLEVHVRHSSSYYQSLLRVNDELEAAGARPIQIVAANENLEDDDLLEMVNAQLIPAVIVDSHKAKFWQQVFADITVSDVAVSQGMNIGWALRKDSPQLKQALNEFVEDNRKGSLFGNIIYNRYLKNNKWARNALSPAELEKMSRLLGLFQRYGELYNFDALMLAALGYQESGLDQSVKSAVGAIGIMQVLATTAADPNVAIDDIHQVENNIHAGTKYLRFLNDRYFNQPGVIRI